jgi:hypothetical protein
MKANCGELEQLLRRLHRRRLRSQAWRILQRALPATALVLGIGTLLRLGWQSWGGDLPLAPPETWMVLAAATLGGMLSAHHWLRGAALPDTTLPTSARLADDLLHADALLLSAWEAERRTAAPGARDAIVLARAHRALPDWRARARRVQMHPHAQGLPGLLLAVVAACVLLLLTNPATAPGKAPRTADASHTGTLPSAAALDELREAMSRAAALTRVEPHGADKTTPPSNSATSPPNRLDDLSAPGASRDPPASDIEGLAGLPPQVGQRGDAAHDGRNVRAAAGTRTALGTIGSDGAGREQAPRRVTERRGSEDLDRVGNLTEPDADRRIGLPRHLASPVVAASGEGDMQPPPPPIGRTGEPQQAPAELPPIPRPQTDSPPDTRLSPRLRALLRTYHARLHDAATTPTRSTSR